MKTLHLVVAGTISAMSCAFGFGGESENRWSVTSPDGQLSLTLLLTAPADQAAYPADRTRLYYRVEQGKGEKRCEVVPLSPLGIERDDQTFVDGLRFAAAGKVQVIDETYSMPHGKRSVCHHLAQQQAFTFENSAGRKVQIVLRAANDGVAFRYEFPETDATVRTVTRETTGFRVPDGALTWIEPYQEPSKWTPAYEEYFQNGIAAGTSAPGEAGWAFPALFHLPGPDRWLLLTEAAVDGSYCGCRLHQAVEHNVYRIRFPQPGEGNGVGEVCPRSTLPWKTPWRVIMVSQTLAGIVESTLVNDLNPPCALGDTAWIKPGRASWSWWSDHDSSQDYEDLRDFVDLAAEMGWEYSLVDANWTLMDKGNVRELARHAQSKGVGLLLWYNSGGPHNSVTEKPRGCMDDREIRRFEFELLRKWGVKGVKVDFFQSDKQNIMRLYQDILKDAAEYRMMVNFHGCTLPRGWSRTYPNLMSMEAVRGAECYTFAKEYPDKAPWHNTILPFTRNVVGPMDYTPVAFTNGGNPRKTTAGHELALAVVFESGWLHFADRTSAYRELPAEPRKFLQAIPVAWDDTRLLGGYPGKWVAIARRKGDDWYVGVLNGQPAAHQVALELNFLAAGSYTLTAIFDGQQGLEHRTSQLMTKHMVQESLPPRGGIVLQIRKSQAPEN